MEQDRETNAAEGAFATAGQPLPLAFIARIKSAYRAAIAAGSRSESDLWLSIGSRSHGIHQALIDDGVSTGNLSWLLENPARHDLFYGFDNLYAEEVEVLKIRDVRLGRIREIGRLLGLVVAGMGGGRLYNPEFGAGRTNLHDDPGSIPRLVEQILAITGPMDFPTPFAEEHGFPSSAGIISFRAIHALFAAWKARSTASRILELGAGVGRTAYFAKRMGALDYTLVDLPLTCVAQAMFLGHALGCDAVTLTGEATRDGAVAIISPSFLFDLEREFDLVLNVDSLTEMGRAEATAYAGFAANRRIPFLSINHEANEFTAAELLGARMSRISRSPYWLRAGYVEEYYRPS